MAFNLAFNSSPLSSTPPLLSNCSDDLAIFVTQLGRGEAVQLVRNDIFDCKPLGQLAFGYIHCFRAEFKNMAKMGGDLQNDVWITNVAKILLCMQCGKLFETQVVTSPRPMGKGSA